MTSQDSTRAPFGERFMLRRRLGEGAYGVVHEAYDRRRRSVVALKELTRANPRALARFKGEFRALVDMVHPNLVTLYELFAEGNQWFFTMELVDGVDFFAFVWGSDARYTPAAPRVATPTAEGSTRLLDEATTVDSSELGDSASGAGGDAPTGGPLARGAAPPVGWDEGRLRSALAQLSDGVAALHAAGRLHRDLKPTNVRVTPEGRVVVLDFGLVLALGEAGEAERREFAGTPAYMSPEQAARQAVAEPSDCYAVGVMLFEALTGRRPFEGCPATALLTRTEHEAPRPSEIVAGVPPDLDQLCAELLARDPADRPRAVEIRERAAAAAAAASIGRTAAGRAGASLAAGASERWPSLQPTEELFVGRETELAALFTAFEESAAGRARVVFLRGRSGIGKSALLDRLCEEVRRRRPESVILRGRCHQQESVPYKGVDAAMDALARFLRGTPSEERALCAVPDLLALAQVFPVLLPAALAGAAPGVAAVSGGIEGALEAQESRRRAFAALRELLGRVAGQRPLVLALDDLQWGDADSGALLAEILRGPGAPPLCFVGAFRSDAAEGSPLLQRLFDPASGSEAPPPPQRLDLPPLPAADAVRLARHLLLGHGADGALADRLARESEGNPFLLAELSWAQRRRGAQDAEGPARAEPPTVAALVALRLAGLAAPLRRLLEATAVSGVPTVTDCLFEAAEIGAHGPAALAALRALRLVRVHATGEGERLECYHDRIREALIERLAPETRRLWHGALSRAMEATDPVDPEALAQHLIAAGEARRGHRWLLRAAERASESLAFDRAARLYGEAAALLPEDAVTRPVVLRSQADALAAAGRSAEAGRLFAGMAKGASGLERVDLQRQASELLLKGGHYEEGLEATRQVFRALGMTLPRSRAGAYVAAGLELARLRLRGLGFEAQAPARQPAARCRRADACWAVAEPLQAVDPVLSFVLVLRHTRHALESGDPFRAARGLALHCAQTSILEPRSEAPLEALRAGEALSRAHPDPRLPVLLALAGSTAAFFRGDYPAALATGLEAERLARQAGHGMQWELSTIALHVLGALQWLGRWGELSERLPESLRAAAQRGDLYGAAGLSSAYGGFPGLASDEPERALRDIATFRAQHSKALRYFPETFEAISRAYVGLYLPEPEATLGALEAGWPQLERQGLTQVPVLHVELSWLRGCAQVGAWLGSRGRRPSELLRGARRASARIARARLPVGDALAGLLVCSVRLAEGRLGAAVMGLARAEADLDALGLALHAHAARHLRGRIQGGGEGAALVAAAEAGMRALGIHNPARMAWVFAPG